MRGGSNGEKYLAAQSEWFQEFVTESTSVVQHCFMGRGRFTGEVQLLRDHTAQLQRGILKN